MYFGVTVDDLLDVGEARIQERLNEYYKESNIYSNKGEIQKNYELWEKAYEEMPTNESVIHSRMYALFAIYKFEQDAEKKKTLSESIKEMGEKLLVSNDYGKREGAIQVLAYHSKEIGDIEKAKEYAYMVGTYFTTSNQLLNTILDGEEAVKKCQSNLQYLADLAAGNAYVMGWKGTYSHEEKTEIYRYCLGVYKLLYPNGDYGFYFCRMSKYSLELAKELATIGEVYECLDAIESALEYAVIYDTQLDVTHTSILVNKQSYKASESTKNYMSNDSRLRLNDLSDSVFDRVREHPRFVAAVENLKVIAYPEVD